MKIDEKQKKNKIKEIKKERKEKETNRKNQIFFSFSSDKDKRTDSRIRRKNRLRFNTGKKLGPLHSYETLRGRGKSCWIKADKKFASRAKRKTKEKCAYRCVNRLGTTTAGSSNFDCNNARCWNPLCWHELGLVALPTALYLRRYRYQASFVRGTCMLRLCCRFHRQESGLRRCDL